MARETAVTGIFRLLSCIMLTIASRFSLLRSQIFCAVNCCSSGGNSLSARMDVSTSAFTPALTAFSRAFLAASSASFTWQLSDCHLNMRLSPWSDSISMAGTVLLFTWLSLSFKQGGFIPRISKADASATWPSVILSLRM